MSVSLASEPTGDRYTAYTAAVWAKLCGESLCQLLLYMLICRPTASSNATTPMLQCNNPNVAGRIMIYICVAKTIMQQHNAPVVFSFHVWTLRYHLATSCILLFCSYHCRQEMQPFMIGLTQEKERGSFAGDFN